MRRSTHRSSQPGPRSMTQMHRPEYKQVLVDDKRIIILSNFGSFIRIINIFTYFHIFQYIYITINYNIL